MAFCSKCGTEFAVAAAFCEECGNAVLAKADAPQAQASPAEGEENVKLFVGANYDYFLKKWEIFEHDKGVRAWNWIALLFGFFWMSYRKMYLYSWIFIGSVIVEGLLEFWFKFPDSFTRALYMGVNATFMVYGNYWYKLHVEKKLKEITAMNPPDQVKNELARQGGTSVGAAIGFFMAFIAASYLLYVVGTPQG